MGAGPTAMAFFSPQLRTVLATVHVPLAQAIRQLSSARIVEVAHLFSATLRVHLGIVKPNLALAALNPHAGEDGLLGDDEERILKPAVVDAQAIGVRLSGPYPADTLFRRAVDGEFDGVVALYHDQALIPVKLLGFGDAVNVTLGLTHPRTSPDHGTAYDIAGKNQARPAGMLSALRLAVELCAKR
jgi:4-hydroxythreonine-4-phosphate dehydrogenase